MAPVDFEIAQPAQESPALIARHQSAASGMVETAGLGVGGQGFRDRTGAGAFDGCSATTSSVWRHPGQRMTSWRFHASGGIGQEQVPQQIAWAILYLE